MKLRKINRTPKYYEFHFDTELKDPVDVDVKILKNDNETTSTYLVDGMFSFLINKNENNQNVKIALYIKKKAVFTIRIDIPSLTYITSQEESPIYINEENKIEDIKQDDVNIINEEISIDIDGIYKLVEEIKEG